TLALLSGCSSDENFGNSGEDFLFTEGVRSINISNWARAITIFQQLEAQFPFGQYADQSQLELIYAYYRNSEPEAARAAADRFIRLYPDSESLDYAYYMKGMAYYSEDSRILGRYLPTDPSKRDPGKARESFADFAQLLNIYPNSQYAGDARARMVYLKNLLAAYEVHVAEFYITRQAYLSSLNRARYVVENYQGTPAVPRALEIMVEMYLRLGLNDLADASLEILKLNYPDSPQLTPEGNFIVSAQITDPDMLYSLTFGLLGSNKKDAPLAPSRRPVRIEGQEGFTVPESERKRSFLNVISLGVLGDPGTPVVPTTTQEE
ncbi:MAG: outer membrane protein assembly factor BamD, partial [Gammaproteobacteria bacterium]|nr:outer membrane protein assembly factor BamD [Gammaproteobacteria bacterium]